MRRNNPDITGLATPLKKVLHGKLEKYILIGSMINIRKLYINNFGKFVLIHSDTKMHLEGYQKIHFRGGWGRAIFKTRQFRNSKFTPAANATRNPPSCGRRLHELREQTKKAANAVLRTACGVWRGESLLPHTFLAYGIFSKIFHHVDLTVEFPNLETSRVFDGSAFVCKRQILRFAARRTTTLWM